MASSTPQHFLDSTSRTTQDLASHHGTSIILERKQRGLGEERVPSIRMVPVAVSASTGVMGSVIGKLTTLLGDEYELVKGVKRGIRFMGDELSSMNAALHRLAETDDDQIDVQNKEWRTKVRELSYDIEDCVDRFIHLHSSRKAKVSFVQSMVRKIKEVWEDHQIAKEIQELKALVVEEKERRERYNIDQYLTMRRRHVLLDPRAPTMYDEARNLVGIDGPREEIIRWLKGEERQLKVVSIFGIEGQGKTTIAMEVYRKIDEPFDCRASVTVSRTLDLKKLLRDIIFQINKSQYNMSERWEIEQLIPTLREQLTKKRYLIIIDDIWTTTAWEHVKSALPANKTRSRIITTTRIRDVAKSCCTVIDGLMYEAKPLSEDDSRTLFFRRIFCSNDDCPNVLTEVANDILRKCGGLPLAIISIAGILANTHPTVEAWEKILSSISSAMEKDSTIEKLKRILFLSYFDLPHHLRTCLLYLGVFPEDYIIDARDLIWRWIAEGLITVDNRENMEQLAESYLNELVNRSMIQPIKTGTDGKTVQLCRVHDVVHDFLVSQAAEDNFVTIWNNNDTSGDSSKIRRISIQVDINIYGSEVMAKLMKNVSHLRSVYISGSDLELDRHVPELLNSQVLRLMNVQGGSCTFKDCHVGQNFSRLKYLRITTLPSTRIQNLPKDIGKLQHLETLDVAGTGITELPESIVELQRLVRLFVSPGVQLPDGIGNMRTLERLSCINPYRASTKSILGLGDLINLRELWIDWAFLSNEIGVHHDDESHVKAYNSSLSKLLMSLQTLKVRDHSYFGRALIASDSDFTIALMALSGPSSPLQKLTFVQFNFRIIPSGIRSLVNLTRLKVNVIGAVRKV